MDATLLHLAESQGGVFTTPQARLLGVGPRHLARLRKDGVVRPVARSVSALGTAWSDAYDERLRLRTLGALALYGDAAPAGASALALADLPVFGVDDDRADIVRPVHREVLTDLCRIRAPNPPVRSTGWDPDGEEAIAGAVVQVALDHGHSTGAVAADRALNTGRTTTELIGRAAEAVRSWPDSGRVRTMLAFMDGRSESVGETRLRLFVGAMGWQVTPQRPITEAGRTFGYADLGVDGTNLLLEFDGRVKYGSDPDALWKEKRREDRGRRVGWLFERVIWQDLERPVGLAARLKAARAGCGPPPEPLSDAG